MHWLSVSKHVHNEGKNTRNDKSGRGCIEATKLSRMMKTMDLSDEWARMECKEAESDKETSRCVCAQCELKVTIE